MPAIRDGRGTLHVHDMGVPPASPSGPVERRRASAQQMADFAAERARMAEVRDELRGRRRSTLTSRQAEVIDALRRLGSRKAVQLDLGITHMQSVDQALVDAAAKGLLPADLPDIPARIRRMLGEPSESSQPAAPTVAVKETGPEHEAHKQSGHSVDQDQEAVAPATADVDLGTDAAATAPEGVATLPGPTQADDADDLTLGPALPCGSCVHTPVCSLRPLLEAWATELDAIEVPQPDLAAVRVVAARLDVVCDYFLEAPS